MPACRRTLIVHGRLAMRAHRAEAARRRQHGLSIMTFEQAAARLAGGFLRGIDDNALRIAVRDALADTDVGELGAIKTLPGMAKACADTLRKAWRAGIDLAARAPAHPRLAALAALEAATLPRLPGGMTRPGALAEAAMRRLPFAPALLGPVDIEGLTELSPVWRPLLIALGAVTPTRWVAGPRTAPDWLKGTAVTVESAAPCMPRIAAVSAATAYHEAIEAMRWARGLLAAGVPAQDIALAAASTADYDDHLLALDADAQLDLHFAHGVKALATRDGQAAAALADIVLRGLSQSRVRRLSTHCRKAPAFAALPEGWIRMFPRDAPLDEAADWERLIVRLAPEDWADGRDHASDLRALVTLLMGGVANAGAMGEALLQGGALGLWRVALQVGPGAALDATLESLRVDDGRDPCVSVAWTPASALAAAPRANVRLLGLNSGRWPRGLAEDRLVPDHVVALDEFDPLPVNLADRRDFESILATTGGDVVLSRARRDADGRLLGRSPVLAPYGEETYLRRNAPPAQAFSESDRILARPKEFETDTQARGAAVCWRDWRSPEITAHDGKLRADHPLIGEILARTQWASSLSKLLRHPLGFMWSYAFQWRAPQASAPALTLDAQAQGDLIHAIAHRALVALEQAGGFAVAPPRAIDAAIKQSAAAIAAEWETRVSIPPALIWRRTLDDACAVVASALAHTSPGKATCCFGEVAFGGLDRAAGGVAPWDGATPVAIPGTAFHIRGSIDRLDLSADGKSAVVIDYKTGRLPKEPPVLKGGAELQRCLYAFAVRALLGAHVETRALLLYPREGRDYVLEDPAATLADLTTALAAARGSLAAGAALAGPAAGGPFDDLAFALPANAAAMYVRRKQAAIIVTLGAAADIWETP